MVIQAVMFIFRTLGLKCVKLLPQMMNLILNLVRSAQQGLRDFLFQQLGLLVSIIKQYIRPYLDKVFLAIHEFWDQEALQPQMLFLIGEIASALRDEFKSFIPRLIPKMLSVLSRDAARRRPATCIKVLLALEKLDANLERYLDVTIPAVMTMAEQEGASMDARIAAIQWIARSSRRLNVLEFASRIIHPLARVLEGPSEALHRPSIMALCSLMHALGEDFVLFAPLLTKCVEKKRHTVDGAVYRRFLGMLHQVKGGETVPYADMQIDEGLGLGAGGGGDGGGGWGAADAGGADRGNIRRIAVNQANLKRAWEASSRTTREDWSDWLRRFSVELLRESPSPALRSCAALAQVYHPLARQLFNAAFTSCWSELYEPNRESLVRSLELAFSEEKSGSIPPEVLQTLLALAEFMEHDERPLPIDIRLLSAVAERCQAYAKALHYKEMEFVSSPCTAIHSLISVNDHLGQTEAANGLLVYAQKTLKLELKESVYEKLNRWDEALEAYGARLHDDSGTEAREGYMRCLHALGEWEQLQDMAQDTWHTADMPCRVRIAPLAAAAACQLGLTGRSEMMESYVECMPLTSVEGAIYKGMLLVHTEQYDDAKAAMERARELLNTRVTALVSESYERAYRAVVLTQQVVELEEVLTYKMLMRQGKEGWEEECFHLRSMWTKRLRGVQSNVEVWQSLLAVHSLVIAPEHNVQGWLKLASLCRKTGKLHMCYKAISKLLRGTGDDGGMLLLAPSVDPKITLAWVKYLWATDQRKQAMEALHVMTRDQRGSSAIQARCHLKAGLWLQEKDEQLNPDLLSAILHAYRNATQLDTKWYKAWHHWALFHFDLISYHERGGAGGGSGWRQGGGAGGGVSYLVAAVNGFVRSIDLGVSAEKKKNGHVQQDILRLLTLWFKYGNRSDVVAALEDGFTQLSIDTWLTVIPQIIARINIPDDRIRASVHKLLLRIGQEHPQALVYPLTVASKSPPNARMRAAEKIMAELEKADVNGAKRLIGEAKLVSRELIRVAILWHEQWYEALEEASNRYFIFKDTEGMLQVLQPMHELMAKGAQTTKEKLFEMQLGRDLEEALAHCQRFRQRGDEKDIQQAWDLYYGVFRHISKLLPRMGSLELEHVSPELNEARDLTLSMPGHYRPGEEVTGIQRVEKHLQVISSKQRPRKCTMIGSDGQTYQYLLKGHEDLRQDERVMQVSFLFFFSCFSSFSHPLSRLSCPTSCVSCMHVSLTHTHAHTHTHTY